jgi:hypothetical protein
MINLYISLSGSIFSCDACIAMAVRAMYEYGGFSSPYVDLPGLGILVLTFLV